MSFRLNVPHLWGKTHSSSAPRALQYILYGLINSVSNLNYFVPREALARHTP